MPGEAALSLAASTAQGDNGCPSNAAIFPVPGESRAPALGLIAPGGPRCSESTCSFISPRQVTKRAPNPTCPPVLPSHPAPGQSWLDTPGDTPSILARDL